MKFHGRWLAVMCLALAFTASHAGDQVYRWVDKQGRVHYGDRPPANATPAKVRAIPVPVEPSAMARLRVEPGDGEYLAWADNNLSGPIEVMLGFSQNTNMRGEPALPARATVPARGSALIARLDVQARNALQIHDDRVAHHGRGTRTLQ